MMTTRITVHVYVIPAYICVQGMPYTPTKLEQYAESVITAVSVPVWPGCGV